MMSPEMSRVDDAVSALVDGQLRGAEFAVAVSKATADAQARADWHAYHVVGDVLRSRELADCAGDMAFVSRFRARLGDVQTVAAGNASFLQSASILTAPHQAPMSPRLEKDVDMTSANDGRYGWKLLSAVASITAVVAIGWNILGGAMPGSDVRQLAQAQLSSSPVLATPGTEQTVMIRDSHLDALMAAHKQFGGTSALQMPAGFLRNATFEPTSR